MILTVTLNPALDRIYEIDDFTPHRLHRLTEATASLLLPGGKGVNISFFLKKLGVDTTAMGLAAGRAGHILVDGVNRLGIPVNFAYTEGETRTNTFILDRRNQTLTEIIEPGPVAIPHSSDFLWSSFGRTLEDASSVVVAGSPARGLPPGYMDRLITSCQARGRPVLLHCASPHLERTLSAEPDFVVPDMRGRHELFDRPLDGSDAFLEAGRRILGEYERVDTVFFVHRLEYPTAVTREGAFVFRPQNLRIAGMLGYADAVCAGFLCGLRRGLPKPQALRFACAAGLVNVESTDKLHLEGQDVQAAVERIDVEEFSL